MSDLIERQAAIDALNVLCEEHRYKIPGKRETYSQYNEAWQDALDRAEGAIFNLPSAQSTPHWIPCSERLPKPYEYCLWTTTDGRVIYHHCDGWFSNYTAWMPLPEPYKETDA